jgi:hypothetical protein
MARRVARIGTLINTQENVVEKIEIMDQAILTTYI